MKEPTGELQAQVDGLHALQEQQPPEEETARIVQQVVEPVLAVMPIPMDIGAVPVTTMGPGQPATDDVMPAIFTEPDRQEELEEPEEDEAARVE